MDARSLYWRALSFPKSFLVGLDAKLKRYYCPIQQRNNSGIYAVNIRARVGFFAQLNWCLGIFAHCQRYGLRPYVILSSPFYTQSKGDNWFEYFFDNLLLRDEDRRNIEQGLIRISRIDEIEQLGLPDYSSQMSLESANRLFNQYVAIKCEIQCYIDSFVARNFRYKRLLGIHYRGTDKKNEADPVSVQAFINAVNSYLETDSRIDSLFVSSDEDSFIEAIRKEFSWLPVTTHDDKERSRNGKAIHTQPNFGDNYVKGKEALVNCLLLSKCNVLIRTASFLSAWSSVFNPSLPVIMLNRPHFDKLWFPDREIVKRSTN